MHIDATPAEAQTILKAMRAVAAAGAAITAADRASIIAAARYIFQIELSPDLAGLAPARAEELKALAAKPDLATEAVRFATVMAFVDGTLDNAKLNAVIGLAATLGVKADFVDDIAEVAQGHLRSATAHMIRANLESLTGKPWNTDDAMRWLIRTRPNPIRPWPHASTRCLICPRKRSVTLSPPSIAPISMPSRVKRKRSISRSRRRTIRRICSRATTPHRAARFWPRPSPPRCIAARPCRATSCRWFSAGIWAFRSMSWRESAKGALDPQEFWHAWARGERMKVDLFGPDWDFWAATAQPVDAVRARIGLTD
jgi:tellurite resistance protein